MFFGSVRFVAFGPNSDDHFATHPGGNPRSRDLSSKASIATPPQKALSFRTDLRGVKSGRPKRRDCTRLNRAGINILRQ